MLIVQKYGGMTLADPQKIKAAAKRICGLTKNGHQVVAIVSAMGQTTNQLLELAAQVSGKPNRREMDMLLSTGERVSMSLLSMALHDLGCSAISLTGSQAGIFTDESHGNAFITDVKGFRVAEALQDGKIVVQAGFQGVSPTTKEITTLGRGGTDTTAMAIAIYLKADRCEILKEVPAVFSADPNIVAKAKPLPNLSYAQLAHMCFWGAKVLHYRSAELAATNKIALHIGAAANEGAIGTTVSEKGDLMYETTQILSVNSHERVALVQTTGDSTQKAFSNLDSFLEKNQLAWPQLLAIGKANDSVEFCLTGPAELMIRFEKCLSMDRQYKFQSGLSSVTATCTGAASPEMTEKVLSKIAEANIEIHSLSMTAMGFSLLIAQENRKKALEALHQLGN
jgi:aspartate kinase